MCSTIMITLKNTRLLVATLFALFVGAFFVAKAMSKTEDKKSEIVNSQNQLTEMIWYYQLNSTVPADINNPANYALTKPDENVNCGSGTIVCEIQDTANPSNSSQPALSHGSVSDNPLDYNRTLRTAF